MQTEGVRPGRVHAEFAPPADFIEPDRGDRPDEGKARRKRIEQRQHVGTRAPRHEHGAGNGVDQAEKNIVRRLFAKIVEPEAQRVHHVGQADLSYSGMGDTRVRSRQNMECCHGSHSSTTTERSRTSDNGKTRAASTATCIVDYT
ncbi:hypothetical protein D3C87_1609340 [compost metagenome]